MVEQGEHLRRGPPGAVGDDTRELGAGDPGAGSASAAARRAATAPASRPAAWVRPPLRRYSRDSPSVVSAARTVTGSGSVTTGPSRRARRQGQERGAVMNSWATADRDPARKGVQGRLALGLRKNPLIRGISLHEVLVRTEEVQAQGQSPLPPSSSRSLRKLEPVPRNVISRPSGSGTRTTDDSPSPSG